ncbi:hypothetical protein U0070_008609, partial [Myodes glareolus]
PSLDGAVLGKAVTVKGVDGVAIACLLTENQSSARQVKTAHLCKHTGGSSEGSPHMLPGGRVFQCARLQLSLTQKSCGLEDLIGDWPKTPPQIQFLLLSLAQGDRCEDLSGNQDATDVVSRASHDAGESGSVSELWRLSECEGVLGLEWKVTLRRTSSSHEGSWHSLLIKIMSLILKSTQIVSNHFRCKNLSLPSHSGWSWRRLSKS